MHRRLVASLAVAVLLTAPLSACSHTASNSDTQTQTEVGKDVIAPVTMSVHELQGATVELLVGQVLNITTDSLAVDSYTGEIADSAIAEFVEGHSDGSADFNPGVTALAAGSTQVTMTNEQGGIQPLEFTVEVRARE